MWCAFGRLTASELLDRRLIALRRILHQVRADHGEDEEHPGVQLPGRAPADGVHQLAGNRAEDAGAGREDADREPVHETAVIGEPLRADGDRREVAETEADAHHHAPRQIQHRQRLRVAGEEQAAAVQQTADRRDRARTDPVLQHAGHEKGGGQHDHVDRGDERGLRAGPAEVAFERRHEHAPRVVGAERDVQQSAADESRPARRLRRPYGFLRRHHCRNGW